jgi:hypothetical protein
MDDMFFAPKAAFDLLQIFNGQIITVVFIKRTTGDCRILNGRLGVKKYTNGVGMAYDPAAKNLITIYDMQEAQKLPEDKRSKAYRCIPLDGVLEIRAEGKRFNP